MSLPRKFRLPLRFERERLDKVGRPLHSSLFTVVKASPLPEINSPRFATLTSRKLDKSAVNRNHLKRQILNIIGPHLSSIPPADYLIIPKKKALEVPFSTLSSDLFGLLGISTTQDM